MDKKSKILLYIIFFLFLGTVVFSYFRYMVFRNFEIFYSESEVGGVIDGQSSSSKESSIVSSDDQISKTAGISE